MYVLNMYVCMFMNFQVSWMMGNTSTSWVTVSYSVALFSMELITYDVDSL